MKGIDGILARAGRSETTTGNEVELDFDSILTGTGLVITMPNSTSGASFLNFKSGSADTSVFSVSKDGNVHVAGTITNVGLLTTQGGITVTTGGVAIEGGSLDITNGNIIIASGYYSGEISRDCLIDGVNISDGQYLFDRVPRYCEYLEDFTDPGGLIGTGNSTPLVYTQTTGTTSPAGTVDNEPLGIMRITGASSSAAGARAKVALQHKNEFVRFVNNKLYYFEARVAGGYNKFGQSEIFVGLTNADTDLSAGPKSTPNCTDWIGFAKWAGSLKWHFIAGTQALSDKTTGTSAYNVDTAVSGTYARLGFKVDTTGTGTTVVTPYVDGQSIATLTEATSQSGTSYPYATDLTWTTAVSVGAAGGNTFNIDYINMVLQR
jgi:hypothetical protein